MKYNACNIHVQQYTASNDELANSRFHNQQTQYDFTSDVIYYSMPLNEHVNLLKVTYETVNQTSIFTASSGSGIKGTLALYFVNLLGY